MIFDRSDYDKRIVDCDRHWANHHRVNGGADPVYTRAMRHADKMEQWAKEHGKAATLPAEKQEGK